MKAFFLLALPLYAQLSPPQAIPITGHPPVVFLNGYQAPCQNVTFSGTFGAADRTLAQLNRPSIFFDNCTARGSIEDLGNAFNRFLESLRYTDGTRLNEFDVIAHSMGGLIVRSYLAGRQPDGTYTPPADPRIRKAIFLATPHAGTFLAALGGNDPQLEGLAPGSPFLFGLGTWNQGREDLRGIDILSLLGDAGSGLLSLARFTDGVIPLTSGSLEAWLPGRTRVLPNYCHTGGSPCIPNALNIAELTDPTRDNVKAVISFLTGTQDWQSIGQAPSDSPLLSMASGLQVQFRDPSNQILPITKVTQTGQPDLAIRNSQTAWTDRTPSVPVQLTATTTNSTTAASTDLARAGTTFAIFKPGPFIVAALPAAQNVTPRAVAPGQFVSIYGSQLASSTAQSLTQPYPTNLAATEVRIGSQPIQIQYVSPTQINVLIPDNATTLIPLTVANAAGQHTINVVVEPTLPALFAPALNAITGSPITEANPLKAADIVALFLTGLGRTQTRPDGLEWALQQPEVTVASKPCNVTYAGRAPGFAGLDQINCTLAADVIPSPTAPVAVRSGKRVSTSSLPVR